MENRPDFSEYLVHFTKDNQLCSISQKNPTLDFQNKSAKERLKNILEQQEIVVSLILWINKKAVCFTECVWGSLLAHSSNYSQYGIGFTKEFIFNNGGNPVFYIRPDMYKSQQWNKVKTFLTPFQPTYSKKRLLSKKVVDYTHEREWRVPQNLKFNYSNIEFIIIKSYSDMDSFKDVETNIGVEKFIVMENYQHIEKLWPTHKIIV